MEVVDSSNEELKSNEIEWLKWLVNLVSPVNGQKETSPVQTGVDETKTDGHNGPDGLKNAVPAKCENSVNHAGAVRRSNLLNQVMIL